MMGLKPDAITRMLRSYGVTVPAFDEIDDLMRRPFAPKLPADRGDFDLAERMADGDLTVEDYTAYLTRSAMLAHTATQATETHAREIREATCIGLLKRDGVEIERQMREGAAALVEENAAASKRLRKAGIESAEDAMRDPANASAWATKGSTHDRWQAMNSLYALLLGDGYIVRPPAAQLAAADGAVKRALAKAGLR